MIQHKDYHEPLFDALQMDVERTGESIKRGEGKAGAGQEAGAPQAGGSSSGGTSGNSGRGGGGSGSGDGRQEEAGGKSV